MSSTEIPPDLRYTAEHEWVRGADGDELTVGITAHAAEELGDIVYVDLPPVGGQIEAGTPCGEIESTKAVSELYAPVSGEVVAVNEALDASPEMVNDAPYGDGWLFRVAAAGDLAGLLDAAAYGELIA